MKKHNTFLLLILFLIAVNTHSQVNEINFNLQPFNSTLPPRTGTTPMSIKLLNNYGNGGPTTYGTIMEIYGMGGHQTGQLYFGGWDNSKIRYRQSFYAEPTWSSWITMLDSKNDVESEGNLKVNGQGVNYFLNSNVGIGTTTPTEKLEISGNTKINGNLTFSNYGGGFFMVEPTWIRTFGGKSFYHDAGFMRTDGTLQVGPNGDRFVVNSNGNVGVGTTTPQSKLDIDFGGEPKSIKFLEFSNNVNSMNSLMRFTWYNDTADFGMVRSGSTPIEALAIRFNNIEKVRFNANGNVAVQGKLEAKEIKVTTTPTADFVFGNDYKLPTLQSVEKHIKEKKHLPEIASASTMEKEGVNVGEFQIKLLQKIEELTLYAIEQQKRLLLLEKEIILLKLDKK